MPIYNHSIYVFFRSIKIFIFLAFVPFLVAGQQNVIVNLGILEGAEISVDNAFNFQVINNGPAINKATVKGTLKYRNSSLQFSYQFTAPLNSGINTFNTGTVNNPIWSFSSTAFKELFLTYKKLPQGTYEYCVEIDPQIINPEVKGDIIADACTYYTVNDIFLINLVDPENNAKIYEYYPMLSWIVNFPFASELTYRIRVAELNKGQNNENAITRNNPVYQDNNVLTTGVTYPVTAKPLRAFQPYVWTVDAFYKGILLGGAEVWKFTIIEDSLNKAMLADLAYVELNIEAGLTNVVAAGELKLKFIENDYNASTLHFSLTDEKGKSIKLTDTSWSVNRGDNRKILALGDELNLKHLKKYIFTAKRNDGKTYTVAFKYVNPYYLKK